MEFSTGRVVGKTIWNDGLFTLHVRAPEIPAFASGQYLQVGVSRPDKHLHRPYSVASPHGEVIDFFVVRVDDGRLTPTLWSLTTGDRVDVAKRALGSFVLPQSPLGEDIWLFGTGTGLAPFIAMLRDAAIWRMYRRIYLLHGVRYRQDLAYSDELKSLAQDRPGQFVYQGIPSRDADDLPLCGRLTGVLFDGRLEAACGAPIDAQSTVMLCGNPAMLEEVQQHLEARGLVRQTPKAPGNLIVERYW